MKKRLKNLSFVGLTLAVSLWPTFVRAVDYKVENVSSLTTLNAFLDRFINIFLIGFMGFGLFFSLLIGGFVYLTAGDNAQKTETAKKIIKYALIGVVLSALCLMFFQIAVNIINNIFG